MTRFFSRFRNEDWMATLIGLALTVLILALPSFVPRFPASLATPGAWVALGGMFLLTLAGSMLGLIPLGIAVRRFVVAFVAVFALAALAQTVSAWNPVKTLGLESVFFSVLFGLLIRNTVGLPRWLEPAARSEYYIKIGLVLLGTSVLFGEIMKAGFFGIAQSVIVVFSVWYFTFWLASRMKLDKEMGVMLASAVSICGVSAAIATCGVIKGDSKKLSYIISLVLVCAVPMMYVMPWLAKLVLPALLGDPKVVEEVAGAWMGGTIDTTGAVVASGALLGETAEQTAVIVKSSQNVLLGLAAFVISLYWSYRGREGQEKPSAGVIWDRFPKFVVGFVAVSLLFSLFFDGGAGTPDAVVRGTAKNFSNTLFSIAFVCIGLETRFSEIFSKENRNALWAFLSAQTFNIVVTFIVAFLLFGVLKPMWA